MSERERIDNNIRRVEIIAIVLKELFNDTDYDYQEDERLCLETLSGNLSDLSSILNTKKRLALHATH